MKSHNYVIVAAVSRTVDHGGDTPFILVRKNGKRGGFSLSSVA